ncbi:MAG: hypothetical protein ABI900_10940 [Betaproteobacteria bacterium]
MARMQFPYAVEIGQIFQRPETGERRVSQQPVSFLDGGAGAKKSPGIAVGARLYHLGGGK